MLQIISGKFFETDNRHKYEGKRVLYSNISWPRKIETCVASLEPMDIYGQTAGYVVSYNNQIEKKDSSGLVRVGDDEILKQFKYLCTFGFKAIFDEDRNEVYKLCRAHPITSDEHDVPSGYVNRFLDYGLHSTQQEIDDFIELVNDVIGLPRKANNVIINCIGAFETSIKLLDEDINLAYSMMIYCAETLAQNFDDYMPKWDDYDQNQRVALEKCFSGIESDKVEKIKNILISNEHLKLTRRFVNFILQYLDDDFFVKDAYALSRAIKKDEIDRALINSYIMRSRYAHSLNPIMKQLVITRVVKNRDVYEFKNDSFLTFGGLSRIVHKAIWNFIKNYPKVDTEKTNWRNELPGIITVEMAPQYWLWKTDGLAVEHIIIKLEGFYDLIMSEPKELPDMRPVLEKAMEFFNATTIENKIEIYALYKLYNTFISEEYRSDGYEKFIKDNEILLKTCCIENLALLSLPVPHDIVVNWDLDNCEEIIHKYNRKKFDNKHIRLNNKLETMIYISIANFYKDSDPDKQKEWLNHALFNSAGIKDLQHKIQEHINSLEEFDINSIFINAYKGDE